MNYETRCEDVINHLKKGYKIFFLLIISLLLPPFSHDVKQGLKTMLTIFIMYVDVRHKNIKQWRTKN